MSRGDRDFTCAFGQRGAVCKHHSGVSLAESDSAGLFRLHLHAPIVHLPFKVLESRLQIGAEEQGTVSVQLCFFSIRARSIACAFIEPVLLTERPAVGEAKAKSIPGICSKLLHCPHQREQRRPAVKGLGVNGVVSLPRKGIIVFICVPFSLLQ